MNLKNSLLRALAASEKSGAVRAGLLVSHILCARCSSGKICQTLTRGLAAYTAQLQARVAYTRDMHQSLHTLCQT